MKPLLVVGRMLTSALMLYLLAACQGGPLIRLSPTATPFPDPFLLATPIGKNMVSILCQGEGEPTILLESGLDAMSWEGDVRDEIKKISRTCVHIRAGMLEEAFEPSRTTQDQVDDLHALLEQAGVPGPFILVGHSVAGLNMLLYTDQYPEDVVGLVFVDVSAPLFDSILIEKLRVAASGGSEMVKITLDAEEKGMSGEDGSVSAFENLDFWASLQQVQKVTSLGDRPIVVLVQSGKSYRTETERIWYEAWLESSQKLSELSSHSRMEVVPDTNHLSIPRTRSVIQAIQEVYDAVNEP